MSNPGGAPGVLGALPLGNGNQSPSSDAGLPPPSDGQVPSSPTDGQVPSSSDSPPSPDGSSSLPPPDGSNSDSSPPQSPPSDTGSSSTTPPPDPNSNSSPPLSSDSPPPPLSSDSSPPPPDSNSSVSAPPLESQTSPPPPESNPDSSPPPPEGGSNTQPPPQEGGSNSQPPPPDGTLLPSPPPPSNNPPDSPPAESVPPPDASSDSPPAPAELSPPLPDNQQPPATGNPPPQSHDTPPVPTSYNPPPSPSSHTSERVPELSSPSSGSSHSSSTPSTSSSTNSSNSSGNSSVRTVAGVTVAGVLIIALIGIFFVIARKKKRRSQSHYDPYGPPPPNFSGNTDGYYYGQPQSQQHALQHTPQHSQQHSIGIPGNSQEYYNGKSTTGPSSGMNSYGSYKGPDSGTLMSSQSCFTYEELMGITEGFSRQNVIGEGGFGAVYKGSLPDGKVVAVKQLKAGSGQGEREFRAEVEIISRVHHRHLVSLVGYCIAENQRLLVYEFVPNNTLEYHLHGKGVPVMEWPKRLKIAVGAARGLAYLHEDCHPRIIHRDIKSANILIDDVFEAQVADFGLAKLSNDISTHVSTRVMGTFGYMAPEYASSGKLTDRSDVFSFGVVLLELVTGRKPVDQDQPMGDESLVEWARPVLQNARETGDYSELADPRLGKRYVEQELIRMAETAAACVRHSAPKRPRMVQVLRALDTDGDMPDISNGVKVGQSTIFECGPNSDLQKFRMMAFGSDDSGEYNTYSGTLNSREMLPKPPGSWQAGNSAEFTSGESETRAINPRRGY